MVHIIKLKKGTKRMSDFLPKDYTTPEPVSGYWNKWEKGQNKFRVLAPAIVGWEWWTDEKDGGRKPNRVKTQEEVPAEFRSGEDTDAKHFWMMPVYDYETKHVRILSIKQVTIQRAIESFVNNEDYGNPTGYDVTVDRQGEGFNTEYSVIPSPPQPLPAEVKKAWEDATISMEVLFEGGDPFELDADKIIKEVEDAKD